MKQFQEKAKIPNNQHFVQQNSRNSFVSHPYPCIFYLKLALNANQVTNCQMTMILRIVLGGKPIAENSVECSTLQVIGLLDFEPKNENKALNYQNGPITSTNTCGG